MKYARPVDHSDTQDGSDIRMIDVVEIPNQLPEWVSSIDEYLKRIFPGIDGFIKVHEGVAPCAKFTGSDFMDIGHFENPSALQSVAVEIDLTPDQFRSHCVVKLGNGDSVAGETRMGEILMAANAASDGQVFFNLNQIMNGVIKKDEAIKFFTLMKAKTLPSSAAVTTAEIAAISEWPVDAKTYDQKPE